MTCTHRSRRTAWSTASPGSRPLTAPTNGLDPMGAVIGRERGNADYLTHRVAYFAAADRFHKEPGSRGSGHRPRKGQCGLPDAPRRQVRGHRPLPHRARIPRGRSAEGDQGRLVVCTSNMMASRFSRRCWRRIALKRLPSRACRASIICSWSCRARSHLGAC